MNGRQDAFSQDTYFSSGIKRNPLLVIYPVELNSKKIKYTQADLKNNNIIMNIVENIPTPVVGLSIGIPKINGKENKILKYKINKIENKRILEFFEAGEDFGEETGETIN